MSPIMVPKNEHGKLRVFALSMADASAQALRKNQPSKDQPSPQEQALGASPIVSTAVEVFPIADLGELGLAGYLLEGIDANEDEVARDGAKLAAVDGWVMLVHSKAFGGNAVTLNPTQDLTLLGTYSTVHTDQTPLPLEAEAAQPYTGVPRQTPATPPRGRAGGSLVVVALMVLAGLILWWALS